MTPAELETALAMLGLRQNRAAALMGVSAETVNRWLRGSQPVPQMARELIRAWQSAPCALAAAHAAWPASVRKNARDAKK